MLKWFRWISVLLLLFLFSASYASAVHEGPGKVEARLVTEQYEDAGIASIWNSGDKFIVNIEPTDNYKIKTAQIFVSHEGLPTSRSGALLPGRYPYNWDYSSPADTHVLVLDLEDDLGFLWGEAYDALRIQNVSIFLTMEHFDNEGKYISGSSAWAYTGKGSETGEAGYYEDFEGLGTGWWFSYEMAHPKLGHFIDSPVGGLNFTTPTNSGKTDPAGGFAYFPGEEVTLAIGPYSLGITVADHRISPLDFFPLADVDDEEVANMARLLQSFDSGADPEDGIEITDEVIIALLAAMEELTLTSFDFNDSAQITLIIDKTIAQYSLLYPEEIPLAAVTAEDAIAHLADTLSNTMFRKNISKTPDLASSKAKMNTATVWLPALKADNTATVIEYHDEEGNLLRTAEEAKPSIVTYTDENPVTGEHDVWAAVSRDDGNTWKRKNLSRMADLSSFTLANGEPYYGGCKKPVFQVRGNKILVAWSSKFAQGGKPRYAIDSEDDYTFDDPYAVDDIWGVAGPQRSYDYSQDGFTDAEETPFHALEVPHSALWICRGIIATQLDVDKGVGEFVGDIVWFKPERLTSGRRDVNQIFVAAAGSAGFAMVWQEDPNGVKPGRAVGPGPGWGGATTSHKTDIWYSYLAWGDHTKVDTNFVPGSDVEHPAEWESNRPKALVPMTLPVRLSDNEVINTDNILVELDGDYPRIDESYKDETHPDYNPLGYVPDTNALAVSDDADGTHAYAYMIPGLIDVNNVSAAPVDINVEGFYTFDNYNDDDGDGVGETKRVAITEDGRLLDGDTGASRGNIFLQPYAFTKPDGSIAVSAWAIITYEETKGAGAGPPAEGEEPSEAYLPEEGKNVIYHSFDFKTPELVSAGRIVNRPEFNDSDGDNYVDPEELVYLLDAEDGNQVLDYRDRPQLAYENARRGRFLPQGLGAFGATGTSQLMVHKQGPDGSGRPSDILLRRWVIPDGSKKIPLKKANSVGTQVVVGYNIVDADGNTVNPYSADCLVGDWIQDTGVDGEVSEQWYYADGVQNVSSVTPTETTDSMGDPEAVDPWGAVKVVKWEQTEANLNDPTGDRDDYDGEYWTKGNPFDDARAHRGAIRGDFVTMGFSYTANWAAARNGNDNYNFYIRRSFDGGQTWRTDPDPMDSDAVYETCNTWTEPSGTTGEEGTKTEDCVTYGAGVFEPMRNLSQLSNHKSSVIEPRIVAVPGTIKKDGVWTGIAEDKQNPDVFYVAYGTSTNPKKDPVTGEQEEPVPQDLFWSVTIDRGQSYYLETWEVNGEPEGETAPESGESVTSWPWMAKGDQEQGEVQLRMTPDGSSFYASWLDEGDDGSDIVFRRIQPNVFPANTTSTVITAP
ncbi:hypothetical protein SAMN02745165_01990 [Malonomonas rubra DSM 5091]|uniref:Uncharacterized protein n=1 Tax=Malonomonas rubra DSM 5091 TaxID=1122189 RepID=A0A1M6I3C0_MALRU|nr:choice-of-anchor O protein [Malonomonas rubra]SHJ28834.1 hypothetical protein SAMN02745165_01990 [Malonomonas rubra DSM 5091]